MTTHRVLLVIFADFQLLDATGPAEVFAAVAEHLPLRGDHVGYRLQAVSPDGGLMRSSTGLELMTEALPEPPSVAGCTVLVAGGYGVQKAMSQGALARWLAAVEPHALRCGAICTGAFLLAQAGLLEGRPVVTHWRYAALLQRMFPGLRVLEDALFVRDGRIYSSAGVTAGMDLSLSLVEEDHGREVSLQVAKGLVMYLRRPGGQRQFSAELLMQQAPEDGPLERLVRWLREHLHEPLDVEDMAAWLAISPRTLHRHCQGALGITPAKLLLQLRLDAACRLLEGGGSSLKRVALQSGFASEYNLRRAFVQVLGVTPGEYRQRFCR
ncbi:helix-turn-helix domain-containing protein [Pseudomonas sp. ZM23]|uniref:Helix-turn-helix domain-containing protein n=1 Tax=Pseudomonas triclosanedens TaxID=2961893 RepID=A0ABY6ZV32_9PSED|nr:helix-turn-helix domain-containing protein [Pseudomonas triclosanedens]MCP8465445.1 helix-turn-helix domain-containing protein [Pseudomonas triclosanedens]MCP8470615.1 helix-turn-helix domain-containing protein [Pseudomonas triclosanedens]MCP8476744.1 helix-turn-helix domain-containing protein [Pseudomonas triclosanedens]WAI48807.1 helix-turn-helix domain-containing protein [Pseudomonas triclosanedens]